jgi:polysaccharide export outer membrane protein
MLYLTDIPQQIDQSDTIANLSDLRLQPDDLLSITVSSNNPDASRPFNPSGDANSMATMAQAMQGAMNVAEMTTGYFVDADGFIDFPNIGKLYVNKKTLTETKAILLDKLKTFIKDPVVNIRFLNLKITVMGEVLRPGTIRLTNKRLTIFEAIGMAGDLTPYSNRRNILLIREKNGKRTLARLNLQSSNIFRSPYYYLQQNDVVIVEPTKNRTNTVADPASRTIPYITAGISVIALILTLIPRTP